MRVAVVGVVDVDVGVGFVVDVAVGGRVGCKL